MNPKGTSRFNETGMGDACVAHTNLVKEIEGNVNHLTGDIDFPGKVLIKGDVEDGVSIRATGDVEVWGQLGAITIQADGCVILKGGISGHKTGHITAGGDVQARFAENATVISGGSVTIVNACMHSMILADREISLHGGKGLLVGGSVRAGGVLSANIIGSRLATPTEIEVETAPLLRNALEYLTEKSELVKEEIKILGKDLDYLKELDRHPKSLPPHQKRLLADFPLLQLRYSDMPERLRYYKKHCQTLQGMLNHSRKDAKVIVSEIVYPGVKITINHATLTIRDHLKAAIFTERDGEIHISAASREELSEHQLSPA